MPRIEVPDVLGLVPGQHRVVPVPEGRGPYRSVIVTRSAEGLRAYWNVCRHLPIPLDSGAFVLVPGPDLICLTHGARYRAEDGRCVAGPCKGAALEPVPLVQQGDAWFLEV